MLHNIRKSWKIIKILLGSISHKDKIEKITVGDKICIEPFDITNKLYDYFCSDAENLDNDLPPISRPPSDFVGPSNSHYFCFFDVTFEECTVLKMHLFLKLQEQMLT